MRRFFLALGVVGIAVLPLRAHGGESWDENNTGAAPRIKHQQSIALNDGTVRGVAFSPDGQTVAACGNRFVQLFDLKTGTRLQRFEGHTKAVLSVAFSPDGKLLASSSKEKAIRLWFVRAGTPGKVLRLDERRFRWEQISRVVFLPNGKTLVSCSLNAGNQNQIQLWDVEKGWWIYRARIITRQPLDLAVSPDGKLIAVGEKPGIVALWEVVKSGLRTRFPEDRTRPHVRKFRMHHDDEKAVSSVAFSSDSKRLLSSGWDNTARVWDVKTGRLLLKLNGPKNAKAVQAALFSPDGSRIVSVTATGTIQIWHAADGKLLASVDGSDKVVRDLAISPDGKLIATCGDDGIVKLWDVQLNSGIKVGTKPGKQE